MTNQSDVTQSVMEQIQTKKIRIRPHLAVLLERIGLTLIFLSLLIITIWLLNFVLYGLKSTGELGLFLRVFPLPWLLLTLVFVVGILIGLKRMTDYSYKLPSALFILIVLGFLLGFAGALAWSGLNEHLLQETAVGRNRSFQFVYEPHRGLGEFILIGQVDQIGLNTLTVHFTNQTVIVHLTSGTRFPADQIQVGDYLRIVGSWDDQAFTADQIVRLGPIAELQIWQLSLETQSLPWLVA